jgi:hypothetical protein
MIGYRGTERQIKWAGRLSLVLRVAVAIYLIAWVYTVGRTWLVQGLPQEAMKSFALGLAVIGVLFFLDRRLGDFRRR